MWIRICFSVDPEPIFFLAGVPNLAFSQAFENLDEKQYNKNVHKFI